jgi:hypothetical protein
VPPTALSSPPCSTVTDCPTDARQWRQQTNNVQM